MQILNEGKRELVGKVFFKCENCECEFIANEGEWETRSNAISDPTRAFIDCPSCGKYICANIENGHKEALYRLRDKESIKLRPYDDEE